MPDHNPTTIGFHQNFMEKFDWMHILCLTDVDYVLVFDESTKDLEEGRQVNEFGRDIEVVVAGD